MRPNPAAHRRTIPSFLVLILLWLILLMPSTAADSAANIVLRFYRGMPSTVSTASDVTVQVEIYNLDTHSRVNTNGKVITLGLWQGSTGIPTVYDFDLATASTVAGLAIFPNIHMVATGTDFFLSASATGYTTINGAPFEVQQAYVLIDPPSTDVSTASRFIATATIHMGYSPTDPVDILADGVDVKLGLAQNPSGTAFLVNGSFASSTAVNGVANFYNLTIDTAGANYFFIPYSSVSAIWQVSGNYFNVAPAMARIEPNPVNMLVNSSYDVTAVIRAGDLPDDPVDELADNITMRLTLLQIINGVPNIVNSNFATAPTINGVATFTNLSISTTGTGYYYSVAPTTMSGIGGLTSTTFSVLNPATVLVSFSIQGYPTPPHNQYFQTMDIIVTPEDGGLPRNTAVQSTSAATVGVGNLLPGSYRVWIKGARTLALAQDHVSLSAGGNVLNMGQLRSGDANNSNTITIADFSILATAFGKSFGQVGYDYRADFNGDNAITIADFSLLASNFGQAGAAP